MSSYYLARAMARVVSGREGLTAVYLPEGVGADFAHALAREANVLRSIGATDYAVVIRDPDGSAGDPSEITAADLVRYRQGNRLAIAFGRVPELSSLTTSFTPVLGQSFPEPAGASGDADEILTLIAADLLSIIIEKSGARRSELPDTDLGGVLTTILNHLRLVHRESGHGLKSWNHRWFDHVELGAEQLVQVIEHFIEVEPTRLLQSILAEYSFAAFGLPTPANRSALAGGPRLGSVLLEAHGLWWGTTEAVKSTFQILERQTGKAHPAAACEWDNIDRERAVSDDPLLAWAVVSTQSVSATLALSQLSESQFLSPAYALAGKEQLTVLNSDWDILDGGNEPVAIVALGLGAVSEVLRVPLPTSTFATLDDLESSEIALVASKGFVWEGALAVSPERGLFVEGRVRPTKPLKQAGIVRLSLRIPGGDRLTGDVMPADDAQLLVLPSASPSITAIELGASGLPTRAISTVDLNDDEPSLELRSAKGKYRLVVRSTKPVDVLLDGRAVPSFGSHSSMYSVDFTPQENNRIAVGEIGVAVNAPQRGRVSISPVVAAISQDIPSPDALDERERQSLRGRYEETSTSQRSTDEDWWRALGHVSISIDDDADFHDLVESAGSLMPASIVSKWGEVLDHSVDTSIFSSGPAMEFRDAFEALDLFGKLSEPELSNELRWPSRFPRRSLWTELRRELDRYLRAYSALIEHARSTGSESALFWASYPFSMSLWSLAPGDAGCQAVMLSPLHPLRVAWQAAAEAALWDSPDAELFAGTIQGYGFPLVGPNEHTATGMLAVQSDAGADQVFLSWSILVTSSSEKFQPLSMPSRAGGSDTPGTAASGLNASAVDAALKTYRRINPHVSTITIDLASKTPSPRLGEVDDAIVSVLAGWSKSATDSLPGGARVLDSSNRKGPLPLEAATTLVRSHPGMPLSWSRYEHIEGASKRSNLRVLEDAGLRVRVKSEPALSGDGLIGAIPLRRYDSSPGLVDASGAVRSLPSLSDRSRWQPFAEALRAVENRPSISSKLQGTLLVDDRADWTVSGESMLSPTALSNLLDGSAGRRMLWEWRPPLFSKNSVSLEQKPYLSVARVPPSFQKQLEDMLSKAMGRVALPTDVDRLLATLGARGVGLSSLLAMGGTQASGALGFYLAFRLLDKSKPATGSRFVLPIDACDSFLRALAGGKVHGDDRRRADLLVIDINKQGVVVTPLEIKFYGFGAEAPSHVLPTIQSAAMGEPLGQLDTTAKLLRGIANRQAEIREKGNLLEEALWSNALGALVDAASKLDPRERDAHQWNSDLSALIEGEREVRVGAPLVMYFNFEAAFADGSKFKALPSEEGFLEMARFGALIASSEKVFQEIELKESELVEKWNHLLTWAVKPVRPPGERRNQLSAAARFDPVSDRAESNQSGHESAPVGSHEAPAVPVAPRVGQYSSDQDQLPAGPQLKDVSLVPELTNSSISNPPHHTPGHDTSDGPRRSTGAEFPIGNVLDGVAPTEAFFRPGNTDLNQLNIGVAGDLGTGKTQLLKSLVFQLRKQAAQTQKNPLSLLIFDYKRDYQDKEFLRAVGGTLLRPEKIPLNVFAIAGEFTALKAVQRARMFVDVISKIYGGVGPVQKSQLQKAIVECYGADGSAPTIGEVLSKYRDGVGKPDSVSSILEDFVMAQIFSEDHSELRTFEELIDDRVLIVALSDLGVDQAGKNALVVLFLNMYYDYMLRATKWPYSGLDSKVRKLNSFLLVDEATNIMEYDFPVLMQLLLQGREFGFGTILASQYLSHFKTSKQNYGEPLLTWFIHKVPNVSAKELQQLGVTTNPVGKDVRIAQLPVHQAFYASLGHPGVFVRGTPFFELIADAPAEEAPST